MTHADIRTEIVGARGMTDIARFEMCQSRRDRTDETSDTLGAIPLAGTGHGDNLWVFGLDGTVGPAPPPGKGTAVEHAGEAKGESQGAGAEQGTAKPDVSAGQQVFADNCSVCHGATGHGGNGGPDLTSIPTAKQMAVVVKQVENGGGGMPAFRGQLTQQQIENVATYVTQKITNK